MNERQRFDATMHYRPRHRAPICDFSFWDETLELYLHYVKCVREIWGHGVNLKPLGELVQGKA